MANKLRKWASRRRSLILVVGLLLVIGVLVLVVVGALWWKGKRDAAGQTNPVLVDADPSGGEGVVVQEVEVGLPAGMTFTHAFTGHGWFCSQRTDLLPSSAFANCSRQ